VISVRSDRDVMRYTMLMTAYAVAVPAASVAFILYALSTYANLPAGLDSLLLTLSITIPLFITPPVAWVVLLLLKRLTLATERINRHVQYDLLTGALNRSHFLDQLRATREPGILMIADLDHFKSINDHHGHDAGDQALILFTNLLQREVGPNGLVARLGGEEFAIFLPGQELAQGQLAAQRLCLAACHARTISDTPHLHPTVTLGGTLRTVDEPIGITLKRADIALYAAKREGRNRARFDEELPQNSKKSLAAVS
jgi:diguanylate cyclase (GGDEF)-like protein